LIGPRSKAELTAWAQGIKAQLDALLPLHGAVVASGLEAILLPLASNGGAAPGTPGTSVGAPFSQFMEALKVSDEGVGMWWWSVLLSQFMEALTVSDEGVGVWWWGCCVTLYCLSSLYLSLSRARAPLLQRRLQNVSIKSP